MSFLWEVVKGVTPLEMLAGLAVLVVLIGLGAWRDANRAPHRYRPEPAESAEPPPDRTPGRTAHSH
jgi:hypothetical protein